MSLPKQILPSGEKLPIECQVDHCLRCGKPVDPSTGQVLEHDLSIAEWHDFGMPKENSGSFDLFGKECVKVMRDRARLIGGRIEVANLPAGGFRVRLSFPAIGPMNPRTSP